jgi:superoxide dismutase, Cu-Zn family
MTMQRWLAVLIVITGTVSAQAQSMPVDVKAVSADGIGASLGTIALSDTPKGLLLSISLTGIVAGQHGLHLHEKGDCAPGPIQGAVAAAGAAGGHFDPDATGVHAGPTGEGHRGDLPVLEITTVESGKPFAIELLAPRLTLADVKGRALIIHAGGDTYTDTPAPLGGGGARIACGVVP